MALNLLTAPATEPLTLREAKLHLRVTGDDENDYITDLILAARQTAETFTHRALITQSYTLTLDGFPCGYAAAIVLPKPPLRSITSIQYVDTNGDTQTWSSALYQVDAPSGPWARVGRVMPAYQQIYPINRTQMNAVTITFAAGYGEAKDVPAPFRHAIRLWIAHWYRNRESVSAVRGTDLPDGVDRLLWPFKAF